MNQKHASLLAVLLIAAVLLSGCAQESGTSGNGDSTPAAPSAPKTEIRVNQMGVEMVISPSEDKVVEGVIKITLEKVPSGTNIAAFVIQGPGVPDVDETGPNISVEWDCADGCDALLDTREYDNGVYLIGAIVAEGLEEGTPPLGAAQTQIEIRN